MAKSRQLSQSFVRFLLARCRAHYGILVIIAASEAADQVPYAKRDGGGRVWALLYGCTKKVISSTGAFANDFGSIGHRLLRLSVRILHRPLHSFYLALELAFYVAGRSSETLFYLAAEVFSIPNNAIFVHELIPNGIQHFNRWNGSRFRCTVKTCTG
jgi:hypothetical protein